VERPFIPAGVGATWPRDDQRAAAIWRPGARLLPVWRELGSARLLEAPCPSRQAGCWRLFRCHLLALAGAPGAGAGRWASTGRLVTGLASEPEWSQQAARALLFGERCAVCRANLAGRAWRKAPCVWPTSRLADPPCSHPCFCLPLRGLC